MASALDFPGAARADRRRALWVLELFHGPTLAFKDVGARTHGALARGHRSARPAIRR